MKISGNQRFQLGTVGALSLSVVPSLSIVICNKALTRTFGFTFATTLTIWHLLVTFCSLHVALWIKFFKHKPFDPRAVMGFGILNGSSIGLLNLGLDFNYVGFYQIDDKIGYHPLYGSFGDSSSERYSVTAICSRKVQLSLAVLLLGVGIATVTHSCAAQYAGQCLISACNCYNLYCLDHILFSMLPCFIK